MFVFLPLYLILGGTSFILGASADSNDSCPILSAVSGFRDFSGFITLRDISILGVAVIYNSTDHIDNLIHQMGCDPNYNGTYYTKNNDTCSSRLLNISTFLTDPYLECPHVKKVTGYTPLHLAVWHGSLEVVEQILQAPGINLDAQQEDGSTAVHDAVLRGDLQIVKALQASGANLNIEGYNHGNYTPLIIATWFHYDSPDIVQFLINNGANINGTSVFEAALGRNLEIVKMVVEAGADPHILGHSIHHGWTSALTIAAKWGDKKMVRFLIEAGVDLNVRDTYHGKTALYYAQRYNHKFTARILENNGAVL